MSWNKFYSVHIIYSKKQKCYITYSNSKKINTDVSDKVLGNDSKFLEGKLKVTGLSQNLNEF